MEGPTKVKRSSIEEYPVRRRKKAFSTLPKSTLNFMTKKDFNFRMEEDHKRHLEDLSILKLKLQDQDSVTFFDKKVTELCYDYHKLFIELNGSLLERCRNMRTNFVKLEPICQQMQQKIAQESQNFCKYRYYVEHKHPKKEQLKARVFWKN